MGFTGKIDAIKAMRELICNTSKPDITTNSDIPGLFTISLKAPYIGLKDAKDFIEDVMALNPVPKYVYELHRVSALDGKVLIEPVRVGVYATYTRAATVRDNIMRLKHYNEAWESENDFSIVEIPLE